MIRPSKIDFRVSVLEIQKFGKTLEQIYTKGDEAKAFCNDISMEQKVQEMFSRLRRKWGRLKFLI